MQRLLSSHQLRRVHVIAFAFRFYLIVLGLLFVFFIGNSLFVKSGYAFMGVSVIDKETRMPVEGVFLIRAWYIEIPTVAGGIDRFKDVAISISDERGRFSQPLRNFFHLYIPLFYQQYEDNSCVYKPGFEIEHYPTKYDPIELTRVPTRPIERRNQLFQLDRLVSDFISETRFRYYWLEKNRIKKLRDVMEKEREFAELPSQETRITIIINNQESRSDAILVEKSIPKNSRPAAPQPIPTDLKEINIHAETLDDLVAIYHQTNDDEVRRLVLLEIGRTKDRDAVEPLVSIIKSNPKNISLVRATEAALIGLKPVSDQAIVRLLIENPDAFGYFAVRALEAIESEDVIPILIRLMDNSNSSISNNARRMLLRFSFKAREPLIHALKSDSSRIRAGATYVLGVLKDMVVCQVLSGMLTDDDPYVRAEAARALKKCDDWKRKKELFYAYQAETVPDTKKAIGQALFKRLFSLSPYLERYVMAGTLVSDQEIIELNQEMRDSIAAELTRADLREKRKIMFSLAWLGSDWSVEQISKMIHQPGGGFDIYAVKALGTSENINALNVLAALMQDDNITLRESAVYAISDIGNPISINVLIESLRDNSPVVRKAAAASLVNFGSAVVEPLVDLLHQDDIYLRWRAAWIMGHIADPEKGRGASLNQVLIDSEIIQDDQAIAALTEALADPSYEVRWAAIHSLGYIKHPKAIEPLIRVLSDMDAGIRAQAAESLKMITGFDGGEDILKWTNYMKYKSQIFPDSSPHG